MRFDFFSLFPGMFDSYLDASILGRAARSGLISFYAHDIRKYTTDKHRKTDDTPYGGGAGMVMKPEPLFAAVRSVLEHESLEISRERTRIILLSAKGAVFRQTDARRFARYDRLLFLCGRYEGVDERVVEHLADEEISIGEYVLTGGELPAMIIADAVSRLVPGVLGNETSAVTESHAEDGVLEHPHYTKPEEFEGHRVPEVLLGGNHAAIDAWRRAYSRRSNDERSPS